MRAGTLRKRARFERRNAVARGASGERLSAWAVIAGAASVPCSLLPQKGGERGEAGGLQEKQPMVMRCRSNQITRGVTPKDRVIVGGATYNIRSAINPDQRDRVILMTLVEGDPE